MGKVSLAVRHGNNLYYPVVHEDIQWETERKGAPSKLTFTMQSDSKSKKLTEGDPVAFKYDGKKVFYGFIFKREAGANGQIKVTAYDQLRYFKNKHTYQYTKKRADQLVRMIANDFSLKVGTLEKTDYTIGSRLEDDQTLFDVVQNALDLTVMQSGTLYVLYDNYGALTLKDISKMKVNVLVSNETAGDFEYTASIDDQTYNQIVLFYDNDETNQRETYSISDEASIKKWGVLQYTESLQTKQNDNSLARTMLGLYNQKTETLKVTDAFGDVRCRAGASPIVRLDMAGRSLSNYMVIEKATHKFNLDKYTMDLTLRGVGTFVE